MKLRKVMSLAVVAATGVMLAGADGHGGRSK